MSTLKAEYGKKEYAKKNYFHQKDGDVIFRIIPALSQFTNNPRDWTKFHSVIFGYKNMEGKLRPFQSVQVKRNGVIEVEDPAVKRIEELKLKLDQAKKEGNDSLVAKLNSLVGFGGIYSVDKNFHMNVVDLQGNIGVLKIRSSAKELLDIEIGKLIEKGVDPLSLDNGRFFVFTRNGSGNNTTFQVNPYKQEIDSPEYGRVQKDVVHKITPELLAKIEREAQDLSKIAPKITLEEVSRIVASADIQTGKSPVCNEIFDNRWKSERDTRGGNQRQENTTVPTTPLTNGTNGNTNSASAQSIGGTLELKGTASPTPAAVTFTAPAAPVEVKTTPTVTATTPMAPTVVEQTHEEWLKEIGIDPNDSDMSF